MIDDLDRTVEELLKRELPLGLVGQVAISFAAPDSEFPPTSVTLPAVDLFLYDIRENLELRQPGWIVERHDNWTATKRRTPVRVDCSYLVTAWSSEGSTTRALDEHKILSEVMYALLRHPILPEALLQGRLRGQEPPTSALQPGRLQSVGELWQALGGKPKAALNYTVTIGWAPDRPVETELPVIERAIKLAPDAEVVR
jgi:Pvc16 N-terminal domain